jgi:hypothetical protein
VIADLPDKTEVDAWCGLTRAQAALYQRSVDELRKALGPPLQASTAAARCSRSCCA